LRESAESPGQIPCLKLLLVDVFGEIWTIAMVKFRRIYPL
jgi:hypothetical protein